jgi:hypothetical protein
MAYAIGAARDARANARGSRRKWGQGAERSRGDHEVGAAGELVVAATEFYPPFAKVDLERTDDGIGGFGGFEWVPAPSGPGPDVGHWHVRASRRRHGDLIVHPGEVGPFALAVVAYGRYPFEFRIVGFADAEACAVPTFWRDGTKDRPAYFVPQRALVPWSDRPGSPQRYRVTPGLVDHRNRLKPGPPLEGAALLAVLATDRRLW